MEWSYADRQPSQSLHAFFANEIDNEDDAQKFELLAVSPARRGVCYGAYHFKNKVTGEERVSALIIPVQMQRGQPRIGFKVMTEYEGPFDHYRCPKTIYGMLTRFRHCEESAHAKAWRDRVEAWHKRMESTSPLRLGSRIVFDSPVQFDNGDIQAEFVVHTCRPLVLRGDNGRLYRIDNLRDRIGRGDARVMT